ncbi:MAG TPA: hypothetical protein VLG37_02540 [Candidatus Saccharimonadales bacterium]|nr:hypothetical protein [Candidatus Saccharimonadales bacterium]
MAEALRDDTRTSFETGLVGVIEGNMDGHRWIDEENRPVHWYFCPAGTQLPETAQPDPERNLVYFGKIPLDQAAALLAVAEQARADLAS